MSLSNEEREAVVTYRLEKADNAYHEAEVVYNNELWNLTANRLYYAFYYAASALLIQNQYNVHTHAGVMTLLHQHFVSTGKLNIEQGRLAKLLFANRREGDYEDFVEMSKEDIEPLMPKVKALIRN